MLQSRTEHMAMVARWLERVPGIVVRLMKAGAFEFAVMSLVYSDTVSSETRCTGGEWSNNCDAVGVIGACCIVGCLFLVSC